MITNCYFLNKKIGWTMTRNRFIILILGAFFMLSCNANKNLPAIAKYNKACAYYNKKKYSAALELFEEARPFLKGKKEEVDLDYYLSYCLFYLKQRLMSADNFKIFYTKFNRDPRVEEAVYMQGFNLYLESPYSNLGQNITYEAIESLEKYLEIYCDGKYSGSVRMHLAELNEKLAEKSFNNAKVYYDMCNYDAAVVAFINFSIKFHYSVLLENALYLKICSRNKTIHSMQNCPKELLHLCIKECAEFLKKYPSTKYKIEVTKIYDSLLSSLNV